MGTALSTLSDKPADLADGTDCVVRNVTVRVVLHVDEIKSDLRRVD